MHICGWVLPVMNEGSRIETGHHHFPGCKKKQHRNILHYLLLTKHGTKFSLMCLLNVWDISFFIGKFPQNFQRVQLSLAAPWRSHERSAAQWWSGDMVLPSLDDSMEQDENPPCSQWGSWCRCHDVFQGMDVIGNPSLFAQEFQHRGKIHQTQENVWRDTVSKFNVDPFVMDPMIVSTRARHSRVADAAVDPRLSPIGLQDCVCKKCSLLPAYLWMDCSYTQKVL